MFFKFWLNTILVSYLLHFSCSVEGKQALRIISGNPAKLGDVPYQVSLRWPIGGNVYESFCGGSIISPNKVISAAHCFDRISLEKSKLFYVVAGTIKTSGILKTTDSEANGQWRKIKDRILPLNYNFPYNDISVVIVVEPFKFNPYVSSIPVASVFKDYNGSCLASGYGAKAYKIFSPILYFVNLEIINTRTCSEIQNTNMKYFVCTSDIVADIAEGDSGGPLVCKKTGDPNEGPRGVLVGVISGSVSGMKNSSFFTRITSQLDFITGKSMYGNESYSFYRIGNPIHILLFFVIKIFFSVL